jgi:hypothetical protein
MSILSDCCGNTTLFRAICQALTGDFRARFAASGCWRNAGRRRIFGEMARWLKIVLIVSGVLFEWVALSVLTFDDSYPDGSQMSRGDE